MNRPRIVLSELLIVLAVCTGVVAAGVLGSSTHTSAHVAVPAAASSRPVYVQPLSLAGLTALDEFNLVKPVCNWHGGACALEHIGLSGTHFSGHVCAPSHGCATFQLEMMLGDLGSVDPLRAKIELFGPVPCTRADLEAWARTLAQRPLEIVVNGRVRRQVAGIWGTPQIDVFKAYWDRNHPTGDARLLSRPVGFDVRPAPSPRALAPWVAVAIRADDGLVVSGDARY